MIPLVHKTALSSIIFYFFSTVHQSCRIVSIMLMYETEFLPHHVNYFFTDKFKNCMNMIITLYHYYYSSTAMHQKRMHTTRQMHKYVTKIMLTILKGRGYLYLPTKGTYYFLKYVPFKCSKFNNDL